MRLIPFLFIWLFTSAGFAQEIVENGMEPEGYVFKLTEETRFGTDEEDEANFIWPTLNTKIFPGPNGTMYIFDGDGPRVLAFDKDGVFLKQMTGPGNGPGELKFLLNVTQAGDGSLFVMDADMAAGAIRLNRFNPDMSFDKQIPLRELGYRPALGNISPDTRFLGGTFVKVDLPTMTQKLKTAIVDLDEKKIVNEISEASAPLPDQTRISDPAMWVDYLAEQIKTLYTFGMVAFGADGLAYAAVSDKYEIQVYKPGDPKPIRKISRKYKPIPFDDVAQEEFIEHFYSNFPPQARNLISKETMRKAFAKANLPPGKAPIINLIPIEGIGLMVIHDVDMKDRDNIGDVFSKDGRYLCQVKLPDNALFAYSTSNPTPRMVFKDGKAYTILTDENGDNRAVRYSYSLTKDGKPFDGP